MLFGAGFDADSKYHVYFASKSSFHGETSGNRGFCLYIIVFRFDADHFESV
jgi:hypothetical protein